ncbi:glycoside hydrolase/deacetylase [Exidia glandulosa HHB12029]|uniref:chitin deacetylase n=1 Tax=Exidia glandulosa HHB12029 TaxID=1314781 RepID=A0A165Q6X5_EXIGL|nr:glycoside hydrolase/deacetylase [Exidia glandulosa HHB12029]
MVVPQLVAAIALLAASSSAAPHDHDHSEPRSLPGSWYQERSHVHDLFVRAASDAPVGSQQWLNQYPPAGGVPSQNEADIPATWLAAYKAAKAAGKIPNIPVSQINVPHQNFPYYGGLDPMGPEVCSSTPKCKNGQGDIWDAPAGTIGISFDDGPWAGTEGLLDFLESVNQPATHYCIGRNIAQHPQSFLRAFKMGGEMAVHTWSHPQMTNQTDLGVLVELGWTMQIIHDLTGGRVPKYWRPPTGDNDNRVRAIAREVFGLNSAVMWNYDTEDWSLDTPTPYYPIPKIQELLHTWLSGPKSPGLVILEHELNDVTVGIFKNTTWPGIQQYGWKPQPIAQMLNSAYYQNAKDNTAAVTPQDNIAQSVPAAAGGGTGSSSGGGSSSSTKPPGSSSSSNGSSSSSGSSTVSGSGSAPSQTGTGAAARVGVSGAAIAAVVFGALVL